MAKSKRDFVREILEIQSRRDQAYLHSPRFLERTHNIMEGFDAFRKVSSNTAVKNEWTKYVVIGYISAFETLCRDWTIYIIDRDVSVRQRVPEMRDQGLELSTVLSLVERKLSMGELMAHFCSFQSLEQVNQHFSKLLALDYLHEVSAPVEAVIDAETVSYSSGAIVQMARDAFAFRHIFVHETPDERRIDFEKAFTSTTGILAVAYGMDALFMKKWPPTVDEIAVHNSKLAR